MNAEEIRRLIGRRTTWYVAAVDPAHSAYNEADSSEPFDNENRRQAPLGEANCVSSLVRGDDGFGEWHLPCLDIDRALTSAESVLVDALCGGGYWLPSSTPCHSHLYGNRGMEWEEYEDVLCVLKHRGILEAGYVSASIERRMTFLRLPGVKKKGAL